MDSDDSITITDPEDAAWASRQREIVEQYLVRQQCEHDGVSREPRWFVFPYIAVWAVRSKANPDRVGWWAISGDLPTDYITASGQRSVGDVLISFANQWDAAASRMSRGEHLPGYIVGVPSQVEELAIMLQSRAKLLRKFGEELNNGEPPSKG